MCGVRGRGGDKEGAFACECVGWDGGYEGSIHLRVGWGVGGGIRREYLPVSVWGGRGIRMECLHVSVWGGREDKEGAFAL